MNVLIVFTHPNPSSFNHALLDRVQAGLTEAGHETKTKDLYQEGFDPILKSEDLSQLHSGEIPERIAKEHEQLLWADGLVFIYPLWWFERPAILKGWFDVVFTNGVAFKYSEKGAEGLLKHKRGLVMITAGASEQFFIDTDSTDISHRPMTDGSLSFCGVENVEHKIYHDIVNISDAERQDILNEAEELGRNF